MIALAEDNESKNSMNDFYSKWSAIYSFVFDHAPVIHGIRKEAAEAMNLEEGDRVLEVGCGTGGNFRYIHNEVGREGEIVGIDISEGMLEKAERKIERNNWENVELVHGDGAQIELDEKFDAVLFSFCINFFEPEEVLEKWSGKIEDGYIVNAHMSGAEGKFSKPVNLLGKLITIISTPPVYKLRYEEKITEEINENLDKTHRKIEEISEKVEKTSKAYGLVEIDSGKIK